MRPDPHPWAQDLALLQAECWGRLTRGVHDRHAAARHPTLATVSVTGRPQARTVVLRAADRAAGTLDIHTDIESAKVQDLRASPFAALHVWDAAAHLQIRLEAEVSLLTGPAVSAIWASVPDASRQSYGSTPAPGQPIPQALDYAKSPDPACFAVLRLRVLTLDALHLGPQHRRARFDRDTGWAGTWLAP